MWYFEPITAVCRRFLYGGCDGNENRFQTSSECWKRCGMSVHRNKTSDTPSLGVDDSFVDATTDVIPVGSKRSSRNKIRVNL